MVAMETSPHLSRECAAGVVCLVTQVYYLLLFIITTRAMLGILSRGEDGRGMESWIKKYKNSRVDKLNLKSSFGHHSFWSWWCFIHLIDCWDLWIRSRGLALQWRPWGKHNKLSVNQIVSMDLFAVWKLVLLAFDYKAEFNWVCRTLNYLTFAKQTSKSSSLRPFFVQYNHTF